MGGSGGWTVAAPADMCGRVPRGAGEPAGGGTVAASVAVGGTVAAPGAEGAAGSGDWVDGGPGGVGAGVAWTCCPQLEQNFPV